MKTTTTWDELERLTAILGRVVRSYFVIAVVAVLGTAVSVGVALVRARVYRSETLMLYREGIRSSDLLGGEGAGDAARKLGMKLKEKVLSRTSLQQIVAALHLYPAIVDERGYVDAVDEMRGHIAFRIRDGDTFGLSFEGTDPRQAQAVTARLADALVAQNSSNRVEQATATKEFLDEERSKSELDLRQKETALAQLIAAHPEFAREAQSPSPSPLMFGVGAAGSDAKVQPRAAGDPARDAYDREARRIEVALGAQGSAKKSQGSTTTGGAAHQEAAAELIAAQRDLEAKTAHFTDQHPDVRAARAKVQAAEARLENESPEVAPAAPEDREALVDALAKIKAKLAHRRIASDGKIVAAPAEDPARLVALETQWAQLFREVTEAREAQKQVADRQFRADITASSVADSQNAQMVIVDPAYLPSHPVKGGRTVIVVVGFLLSLGLGVIVALARVLLDDRIHDRSDLERLGLAEVLAVVPRGARGGWRRRAGHG